LPDIDRSGDRGFENAAKAVAAHFEPLFEMNKGFAEFLRDDRAAATKSLGNALKQLTDPNTKFEPKASYVLVLDSTLNKVSPHGELPGDVAILINLWRMGAFTQAELEAELAKVDAEKATTWLAQFISHQPT
jgi:hypothetical protein